MLRGWLAVVAVVAVLVGCVACLSTGALAASGGFQAGPPSDCAANEITATFTAIPFSQGAGSVYYLLTLTNRSGAACTLQGPIGLRLLGAHGRPLSTNVRGSVPGSHPVILVPGQWAQAQAKFSPDVPGGGEAPGQCEPTAHDLRLTIAASSLRAPMDPSPVCGHGTIYFEQLQAIAPTPACTARELEATFVRNAKPIDGRAYYQLALYNGQGVVCHTDSIVSLRLIGAGGRRLPTHVSTGISSPYVFPSDAQELALAGMWVTAGRGEPRHGSCEPSAREVAVGIHPGGGTIEVPIRPALRACHRGAISLSGLY